jgi:hypothetical protein
MRAGPRDGCRWKTKRSAARCTGTLKPVYQGGKKVGAVREYSDTLLMFLLNGGRPEKYKHRIDHTSAGAAAAHA